MRTAFATVDSAYRTPLVEPILARWAHDPGSDGGLSASSNFTVSFTYQGQGRFLRFGLDEASPFLRHSPAAVEAELAFIRDLGDRGLRAAQPLPSLRGRWVEVVDTPVGEMTCVVFEAMPGQTYDFDQMPPVLYPAWGRAVGTFHNLAQDCQQVSRPSWKDHLLRASQALTPADALARNALARLLDQLERLPTDPLHYGLVHYDLCADNLFWLDGQPGLIDFDDSCYHWWAADLAFAARDMFDDNAAHFDPSAPSFAALLAGYRQVRSLGDDEVARIPLFLIYNHLLHYTELNLVLSESHPNDEPRWLTGLRERLARKLDGYRAAFQWFIDQSPLA